MRKLLLLCALVACAVPTAALAGKRTPGDGTLQVRDAVGEMTINARGGLIGRCGRCTVVIVDPISGDGSGPIVFGDDKRQPLTEIATRFINRTDDDMRFRIIGGRFRLVIKGSGIHLSVVGNGNAFVQGTAGEYALDGQAFAPLPDTRTRLQLGSGSAFLGG